MKEAYGNLWDQEADAICITTNGYVTKDGKATMGAGCALEALARYGSVVALELGHLIQTAGNHVHLLLTPAMRPIADGWGYEVLTFPVKHHWKEKADLTLIQRSAQELVNMTDQFNFSTVVVPRPGCGNGGLKWENVKPVLEPILDDRFTIITF